VRHLADRLFRLAPQARREARCTCCARTAAAADQGVVGGRLLETGWGERVFRAGGGFFLNDGNSRRRTGAALAGYAELHLKVG